MIKWKFLYIHALLLLGVIILTCVLPCHADDFKIFQNVKYVRNPYNDGDSFLVNVDRKEYFIRLYFVDCPDTKYNSKTDASRVREQTRYFGLTNATDTIDFGVKAKEFTQLVLFEPFIMHTTFAFSPSRSSNKRCYAFITTSTGDDLACLLVVNGHARVHGTGRKTPQGVSRDETIKRLKDHQDSAMMKRVGIWTKSKQSGPNR